LLPARHSCTVVYRVAPSCQYLASEFLTTLYVTAAQWRVTVMNRQGRQEHRTVYNPSQNTGTCTLHNPLLGDSVIATHAGDLVVAQVYSPGQVTVGESTCRALPTCWPWRQESL
jgi:hypothetical protein